MPVIDRFRGAHLFLSNFYPAPTPHRGHVFPSSEHAYMAPDEEYEFYARPENHEP